MTLDEVMTELKSRGNERTVTTYRRHGANGEMFGVKIADLKKILKKIKGDQELALELWETGNADAMYLAGLLADGSQMTRKQLDGWARSAWWSMLGAYSVPWVASEHDAAFAIGMKWLKMKNADMACSGWNTYAAAISVRSDEDLDQEEIRGLLQRVESEIDNAPDKVRYCMNDFVVAVASYVKPLLKEAKAVAKRLGKVEVDMGDTACKVPVATDMIAKIESMGRVGKKRKSAKC
jgi:hypothetical protein